MKESIINVKAHFAMLLFTTDFFIFSFLTFRIYDLRPVNMDCDL